MSETILRIKEYISELYCTFQLVLSGDKLEKAVKHNTLLEKSANTALAMLTYFHAYTFMVTNIIFACPLQDKIAEMNSSGIPPHIMHKRFLLHSVTSQ